MKRIIVALVVVLAMAGQGWAFGVPGLGKKEETKAPSFSLDDALAAQGDLIKAYADGNKFDLMTKSLMADALGLKEDAATLKTAAESIDAGNVEGIEAAQAKTEAAQTAVAQKMEKSDKLSADAQMTVGKSLVTLGSCLLSYKAAASQCDKSIDMAKNVIDNASLMNKMSVKKQLDPVLSVAPKVPGDLESLMGTAKKYVEFAKSAGVEPPSDLKQAIGDL